MSEKPKKVVKNVNTQFPVGFRAGASKDVVILDLLDDKIDHLEIIASIALTREIARDVSSELAKFAESKDEK